MLTRHIRRLPNVHRYGVTTAGLPTATNLGTARYELPEGYLRETMSNVGRYLDLARTVPRLGLGCLARYALHRTRLRTGAYTRTTPPLSWSEISRNGVESPQVHFGTPSEANLDKVDSQSRSRLLENAERIVSGELQYFSSRWLKRPADWRSNPFNGHSTPLDHWSSLQDFSQEQGDIKWIWEPNRFDWATTLGRAWFATGDDQYAETFWKLLEDWARHNPPNQGVNWKCGQECALRMMALVWVAPVIERAPASTEERKHALWRIVVASASRIEPAIGYALSQFNNHGLSESLGLFIAGTSLPNHPRSATWIRKGSDLFEQQIMGQFAPDGSYAQNSMNYQRLALKLGIFYAIVCERSGHTPSNQVLERLRASARFLHNAMDDATGYLPNYGANDGANLLALSSCDYRDYRPILQLAFIVLDHKRIFGPGPWDEEAIWLCDRSIDDYPLETSTTNSMSATDGGYYCVRQESDLAFIRCHTHKSRPGHADMLHLDLWRNGTNLLCDSGTYQYYDPERNWGKHFKSTAAHNTLVVDRQDQMSQLGTFLWGNWTRSRVQPIEQSDKEAGLCFIGEHDAYSQRFGIRHRRSVLYRNGDWLIIDDAILDRQQSHDLTLTWHLDDHWEYDQQRRHFSHAESQSNFHVYAEDSECELLQHEDNFPESGRSLYYGDIAPIKVYKVCAEVGQSYRFITSVTTDDSGIIDAGVLSWNGLKIPTQYAHELWV